MSGAWWSATRHRTWPLYVGVVLIAAALLAGMLMVWGFGPSDDATSSQDRAVASADPTVATKPTPTPAPVQSNSPGGDASTLEPQLVKWGGHGNQLALIVRNASQDTIRSARVEITARDKQGVPIIVTAGGPRTTCCTVLGLPPGGDYGLFANLDGPVREVAEVEVRYVSVLTAPARTGAELEVYDVSLKRPKNDTVVQATVVPNSSGDGYIVGQAFLVDGDDRLLGIISGRFYCFVGEDPRQVEMQFLRQLPPDTRIARTLAYAIPDGVPPHVPHTCTQNSESR